MNLSRREFLLATLGAAALEACGSSSDKGSDGDAPAEAEVMSQLPVDKKTFAHGIASGDPFADSVLLWTRVTTTGDGPVKLVWGVATDPELTDVVAAGYAEANKEHDFTVKVIAEGLMPGTTYYYAFFLPEKSRSVLGRTRTLPQDIEHARLAYTSCANIGNGFFHAYRNIAQRNDLDVWVHLGDYIYEYGKDFYFDPKLGRPLDPPTEALTLDDYRKRYACYKGDVDLQEIHRQHAMIAVWDDHEVADNSWKDGAYNHDPKTEGDYATRKAGALKAFVEWLPIRVQESTGTPHIYRQFAFGKLFDLIMLDTRHLARDEQAGTDRINPDLTIDHGDAAVWNDPKRTILGMEQEDWFKTALTDSKTRGATWRLIGNQVIFSRVLDSRSGGILFSDFWDGYHESQQHVLDHLSKNAISNVVFLTGDIHTSWAFDVTPNAQDPKLYDPATGKGSLAVELVGPAVTSEGLENSDPGTTDIASHLLRDGNPHLKYYEVTKKGYVLVDVTKERVQAEWYHLENHKSRTDAKETLAVAFTCDSGKSHLVETKTPTKPKADAPAALTEE
jgi:alkaline phosphatase D